MKCPCTPIRLRISASPGRGVLVGGGAAVGAWAGADVGAEGGVAALCSATAVMLPCRFGMLMRCPTTDAGLLTPLTSSRLEMRLPLSSAGRHVAMADVTS